MVATAANADVKGTSHAPILATRNNDRDRSVRVYKEAVRRSFTFLKETNRLDDLLARSISLPGNEGFLVPVCELHTTDTQLIQLFTEWRTENAFAFPSQFTATETGTSVWMRSRLLDVEDRMLFLVVDRYGHPVGHLGYANALNDEMSMEIDNVVRGAKDIAPGIMSTAMRALLGWAEDTIGPEQIYLRVFSDNDHAIRFYRSLGFVDGELLPLRKHQEEGATYYQPLEGDDHAEPDKSFLRMIYSPEREWPGSEVILTAGPSISAREASYALDAARNGWNRQWSGYIKRFERTFADYLGVKYALSTSSCTGALHLALATLGIGPGDEVIVPDITWVATANAVTYVGATPIFVDVEPDSWCMDPLALEAKISPSTKAIMPVHLYGHPADMGRIMEIAKKHNLQVVEDAAPSIGAEFMGQKTGTFGQFAAFSFQGAKLAVTGEGGMLVTDNEDLYERALLLWDQGRDAHRMFWINKTGWKYKMSNVQAAIGLGQIERIDEMIEAKRRIFSWYAEGLDGVPQIALNHELPWARSIYWMTSILLSEGAGITRDTMRAALLDRKIDTRPVFPAISQYPIWPKPQEPQPVALRIGNQAINLPSGVLLKREQVDYICNAIRQILAQASSQ